MRFAVTVSLTVGETSGVGRRERPVEGRLRFLRGSGWGFLIVGAITFGGARLGIASRSSDLLAVFWPANAVLVGLMARIPRLRTAWGWTGALAGYVAADLSTGGPGVQTAVLTLSNLVGVVTALLLLDRLDVDTDRPVTSTRVGQVVAVCILAPIAASIPGTAAGMEYFGLGLAASAQTWFGAELAPYLAIVPPLLVAPAGVGHAVRSARLRGGDPAPLVRVAGPSVLLVVLLSLGLLVGGWAALVFPLPALLLAAFRLRLFETAILVLVTNGWNLLGVSLGAFDEETLPGLLITTAVAMQIGSAVVSAVVLIVAAEVALRSTAYDELRTVAATDPLTGLLNRRAFLASAAARTHDEGVPVAVLMMDLDRFKDVNDRCGHPAGDRLLVAIARAMETELSTQDLLARFGGEEFVAYIRGAQLDEATALAEHIRVATRETSADSLGTRVHTTVSIGVGHAVLEADHPLGVEALLEAADLALYEAKRSGRDRVVVRAAVGRREPGPV